MHEHFVFIVIRAEVLRVFQSKSRRTLEQAELYERAK